MAAKEVGNRYIGEMVKKIFHSYQNSGPKLIVKAEVGVDRGLFADVLELHIEHIYEKDGIQDFALKLTVERGDGTVGIHERPLSGFDSNRFNVIGLLSQALSEFGNVNERDKDD